MCQEHDLNAFHEQEAALNSHDWDRQKEIDKAKAEALFKEGHLGRKPSVVSHKLFRPLHLAIGLLESGDQKQDRIFEC